MFVVVVILVQPRVHCILPEKYIYGIKEIEADIKTWGIQKQHKYLVFWSRDLLDDEMVSNGIFGTPDFDLIPSAEFPPANMNPACYYAKIKQFFRKYFA